VQSTYRLSKNSPSVSFSTEKEVRNHPKRMINRNFGSVELTITYIELHKPTQNEDKELKEHSKICC
jgi:disulfide oxidoreductase YuzD